MTRRYLLGSDIGTTLTKTVLVDVDGGEVASAAAGYNVLHPRPLWAEQWPSVWFDALVATVREIFGKADVRADDVAAVAISTATAVRLRPWPICCTRCTTSKGWRA